MTYMDNLISEIGESVTVKTITKTVDTWGVSRSTSTSQIECEPQIIGAEDEEVQEGNFKQGDLMVFFRNDASISEGDIIVFDGDDFEIRELLNEPDAPNGESHLQARASKI